MLVIVFHSTVIMVIDDPVLIKSIIKRNIFYGKCLYYLQEQSSD